MFTTILVQPLFNILFGFYALIPGHDFGVAVIGLTILVRLILWPLVSRQLHSQKAIQKLQPEVAKIREQAAGDRQKESALLMELYKERGVSPFSSLLPLLLQLPILFALIAVFNQSLHADKINELAYGFIKHLDYIQGILSHHASFEPTLFGWVNLTKPNVVLALIAGAAQFVQARQLQPKNPVDDQAKMMASMSLLFPILTIVFALRFPSALALYWAVTSIMAAFQQYWVLLRDAQEMDPALAVAGGSPAVAAKAKTPRPKRKPKAARAKGGAK